MLALVTAGGPPGNAPIADQTTPAETANPLPQALGPDTAIVIAFGLTLYLLALARRQQILTGDDRVEDDLEDRRIARTPRKRPTVMTVLVEQPQSCSAGGRGRRPRLRRAPALRDAITIAGLAWPSCRVPLACSLASIPTGPT